MEGNVSVTTEQDTQGPSRGSRNRNRARRGGRQNSAGRTVTEQPAHEQTSSGQDDGAHRGRGQPRGGTPRGSGHRHNRGGNRGSQLAIHGSRRQFGGQLTTTIAEQDSNPASPSTLNADAPEFTPGRAHEHRQHGRPKATAAPVSRQRRHSKSEAPDIATRIHEDISHSLYECPICTSEVGKSSRIWSCKTCWTVFHLNCIKTWSTNEGSKSRQQANDDPAIPRHWRCPGCNLPQEYMPSTYSCWCEKDIDPKSISGIPPHSCGQTCGRPRFLPKVCPHPCELLCHAGPCPPCSRMGPTQTCFCGKQETTKCCSDTSYDTGWSCNQICGDLMLCGEHTCPRSCHEGLCGACEFLIDARCYCGKSTENLECNQKSDQKQSRVSIIDSQGHIGADEWIGIFDCQFTCGREFDCGNHRCEKQCHPQDEKTPHCLRSPDVIKFCACGKTQLSDISDQQRQSCEEPIPNCAEICQKILQCGHECQQICHLSQCGPCFQKVDISCRCGRTFVKAMCQQGADEPPQCRRVCKVSLNCGRHECGDHCCSGERRGAERMAAKRRFHHTRPSGEDFEAEHLCMRICGRSLKCGNHTCMELCHKGPCGTCREAIFNEISCHCGRTVLHPPLPCGAKPPPCRFSCEREKHCGHPQVPHSCHSDGEICPKCPFLIEKPCMCGKKSLKNQPCFLQDVRCGEICGNKLRCGTHFCRKPCHRSGECEDARKGCTQQCGKTKKSCGDSCEEICHGNSTCKEEKPCQTKIIITCDCQHLKSETKCLASRSSSGNTKKSLKCDDECARLQRNHNLALALNIDPSTHTDDHIPYSTATLNFYQASPKWAHEQERDLRIFAADDTEKRLRYKPMPSHQRAFIHSLAEDFGFDSESMDPEPHRHVALFKTPRFVKAPMKTLAECIRIRARTMEATSSSSAPSSQGLRRSNEPFNGFVLSSPRFGLTVDELRSEILSTISAYPPLNFDISFLPNEEIVLKARSATTSTPVTLVALKPTLKYTILAKELASSLSLCALDSSLNILRRETDPKLTESGWSTVAAKAASGARTLPQKASVGGKNSFTVLGAGLKARKKKEEEKEKVKRDSFEVADDWEEEVRLEEERERAQEAAGAPTDEDPGGVA